MISRKDRGFGLVEVLVSFVIVMVGVMGLIKIQGYLSQNNDYAYNAMIALQLAENKLESISYRNSEQIGGFTFDELRDGESDETVNGVDYRVKWSVVARIPEVIDPTIDPSQLSQVQQLRNLVLVNNQPRYSLKDIELTVSWKDRFNVEQHVEVATSVSRYNLFDQ